MVEGARLLVQWLETKAAEASRLGGSYRPADLARDLGRPRATVSLWLAGGTIPRADHAAALEQVTGGFVPAVSWGEGRDGAK